MDRNQNTAERRPDSSHTIFIRHGSLPVFSYPQRFPNNDVQRFASDAFGSVHWMTGSMDAAPPAAAVSRNSVPLLPKAAPALREVFPDMEKQSLRKAEKRADADETEGVTNIENARVVLDSCNNPPAEEMKEPITEERTAADCFVEKAVAQEVPAELQGVAASPCSGESSFDGCECARSAFCSCPPLREAEPAMRTSRIAQGLLHYKKWWFLREVGISVEGKMLTGTPIFVREDTLRIVNDAYSYFIPLDNVDYIRTTDGLRAARMGFEENPLCEN